MKSKLEWMRLDECVKNWENADQHQKENCINEFLKIFGYKNFVQSTKSSVEFLQEQINQYDFKTQDNIEKYNKMCEDMIMLSKKIWKRKN